MEQEKIFLALKDYLEFVYKLFELDDVLKVKFDTYQTKDGMINAKIFKEDETFIICFSDYFFENLSSAIGLKYFLNLTEKTASDCSGSFYHFPFRLFNGTTCLIEFKNLIAYFVTLNVLSHELSHALLGHLTGAQNTFYEREGNQNRLGLKYHLKEYSADTIGELLTLEYIYEHNFKALTKFNLDDNLTTPYVITELFTTYLSSLFVQYDLFFSCCPESILTWEIEKTAHPHPYVRFINAYHMLREFIIDKIEKTNNINDGEASLYLNSIKCDLETKLNDFFISELNVGFYDILQSKKAWQDRFKIIDFFVENGFEDKSLIEFKGFASYSNEEKENILKQCK